METNTLESAKPITVILILALFFGFYFNLGGVPLFDLDEGAFSEATREMLVNGNYLTTYLNGELRFDKPILIYWLQAFSVKGFGLNEFALRLPSALAATVWVVLLYYFVRHFYTHYTAFMAAFMMATSLQVTIIAKAAIADSLLNLFIASSMFLIYLYTVEQKRSRLYAIFALIALGALTKGPVAILVPLAVSFLFLASKKELRLWLKMVFNPIGILLFFLIASPWYILEYLDQGQAFIDGFFFKHNLNRFNTSFEGHSGSLFYYIPVLLVGLLPYTTLLLRSLKDIRSWFSNDLLRFLAIWFLFVFLFFSFSGTKLPHYVIYGYTPLFILMAITISKIKSDKLLLLPPMILFIILFFLPMVISFVQPQVKHPFTRIMLETAPSEFGWEWYLFFASVSAITLWLMRTAKIDRNAKLISIGIIMTISVSWRVIPTYAAIAQIPIKEAALLAKTEHYDAHLWKFNMPSFIVYREKIVKRTKPKAGEVVLTRKNHLDAFEAYTILYEKHGIILARIGDDHTKE
ncbi:MAG: glycosyltransferase family 39 protein [Epsilonproteobacteria bacterium]|nr:MAG: glycosyltransferase family 39 protein [Campylobacterota bacterium]